VPREPDGDQRKRQCGTRDDKRHRRVRRIAALATRCRLIVLADLAELAEFRNTLTPHGVHGITVECADCGEQHFFGWNLMAANLRALLGEGRTHVHEPAFSPNEDAYVSWDYARGYTDAVAALTKRR